MNYEYNLQHPCIEWEGSRDIFGYGVTRLNRGRKQVKAHRVAYCVEQGLDLSDIEGYLVRHRCDNTSCVQPSHLLLGNAQDNMDDMMERGRHRAFKGESHKMSKLTEKDVLDIRERHVKSCRKNGQSAIARDYGVTSAAISGIVSRKHWRHI